MTALVLYRIYKYRREFGSVLRSSSKGSWTKTGFFRLFLLSLLIFLTIFSLQTYIFYSNILVVIPGWHKFSWKATHGPLWNTVIFIATNQHGLFECWVPIAAGFVVFIFTGFGRDATSLYGKMLSFLGISRCYDYCCKKASGLKSSVTSPSEATLIGKQKWPGSRYVKQEYPELIHGRKANKLKFFPRSSGDNSLTLNISDPQKDTTTTTGTGRQSVFVSWPLAVWKFLRASLTSPPGSLPYYGHRTRSSIISLSAEQGDRLSPSDSIESQSSVPKRPTVSAKAWAPDASRRNRDSCIIEELDPSNLEDGLDTNIRVQQMILQKSQRAPLGRG